ncbi:comF family protein [Paenibacillus sp. UNCCL117]|nr:comF family protein [Paenibacillus sp. cl123]SFW64436.1 comF family protein [Paenibacillus sp. UNCCL117]
MTGMIGWLRSSESLLSRGEQSCQVCGGRLMAGKQGLGSLRLCGECSEGIPWIGASHIRCLRCGRYEYCPDCERIGHASDFVQSRSAVRYNERMKEWLAAYKYQRKESLRPVMGGMLLHAYHLHRALDDAPHMGPTSVREYLTFVPLSAERCALRGFNQAEQMAVELSRLTDAPVLPLLRRTRHTEKQSSKSRNERFENMKGLFELGGTGADTLRTAAQSARVKLYVIDDVYTTGSTMQACSRVIREALPVEVYGITWAR